MAQPTRIEPLRLPDGKVVTPNPPTGGSWQITADGALQPRDEATARAAGLAWPTTPTAPTAPAAVPAAEAAPASVAAQATAAKPATK